VLRCPAADWPGSLPPGGPIRRPAGAAERRVAVACKPQVEEVLHLLQGWGQACFRLYAGKGVPHLGHPLGQPQPRSLQRRPSIIGHRGAHRQAGAWDGVVLGGAVLFHSPLNRSHAPQGLLHLRFRMPVGLLERPHGVLQGVKRSRVDGAPPQRRRRPHCGSVLLHRR
jgi:hypothetical protein